MDNFLIVSVLALRLLLPFVTLPASVQASIRTEQPLDLIRWELTSGQLQCVYKSMHLSGGLPWYTSGYRYTCLQSGQALTFCPVNLAPAEYDRQTYEETVSRILSTIVTEDMSQKQIARSLHDYLITHCHYDKTITKFTPYDAIVQGDAVCSGYAAAYMDLMNRAGVPCRMAESDTMGDSGHAWNLVLIDGTRLHVDVTWDDSESSDEISYRYFLKTDEEISRLDHRDWIAVPRLPQS